MANSVSIIRGNSVIDLLETVSDIKGLAPDTLDSLEKLANAMDNNPDFYTNVAQAINQKADTSYVNTQLATKAASSSVYTKSETDDKLNSKADQSTTYTKTQVDTNFSNLIGAAPQALNTLQELASALSNDGNYATTVQNQFNLKADKTDTYTKTDTDTKLSLKADQTTTYTKTDIDTKLNLKSDQSTTYTKSDTDTKLNLKADQSNTYTKSDIDTKLNLKTDLSTSYTKAETDNKLNNNAAAWSSGLVTDGYHYINTGSDALVIRTNSGEISANFLGSIGGSSTDGKVIFYKDVKFLSNIIVDSLGTTLSDKLNLKANVTDTYTKSDTDTKLSLKADQTTTYTKSDTDTKLSLKS